MRYSNHRHAWVILRSPRKAQNELMAHVGVGPIPRPDFTTGWVEGEISMFGVLRWLLLAAILVSPVTVDLRRGFTWSEASAQDIPGILNCDPVVLNYYSFNQFIGSQVMFHSPPPSCVTPTCVRWGACVSEVRLDFGLLQQSKLNPRGCLLRICTPRTAVPRFGR
jgi:hypothetical protein